MECDYLVWSAPIGTPYGRYAAELRTLYLLDGREGLRYGYRIAIAPGNHLVAGVRHTPGGIPERAMLEASGAEAVEQWEEFLTMRRNDGAGYDEEVSVRRIDMQYTVDVGRSASEVIDTMVPDKGYQYLRLSSYQSGQTGAGLYIGSPTSDIRLRIYDKTAQLRSQLPPNKHVSVPDNLLRAELILRKRKARHLWDLASWSGEQAESYVLHHIIRRVPALEPYITSGKPVPPFPRSLDNLALPQTERWLYETVIPSLARHFAGNREGFEHWLETLQRKIEAHPSNAQSSDDEQGDIWPWNG